MSSCRRASYAMNYKDGFTQDISETLEVEGKFAFSCKYFLHH